MRPRIGITTSTCDERGHVHLDTEYVEAVQRAGGVALLIPPGDPAPHELLAALDGLILSGGGDLHPDHYGGAAHPQIYGVDARRDASELALARAVLARHTPCLCICRGLQVLNVAAGGTLVEHLPDESDGSVMHRGADQGTDQGHDQFVEHEVLVEARSALARVLDVATLTAPSWHHQAIRALAPGFVVSGRAHDGTIEAIESPQHENLLAVQWHPEHSAAHDLRQQRLFTWLIAAAQSRR